MVNSTKNGNKKNNKNWRPFATFVIEYQQWIRRDNDSPPQIEYRSYAHLIENGDSIEWTGIQGKSIIDWILKCVGTRPQLELGSVLKLKDDSVVDFPIRLHTVNITIRDDRKNQVFCGKNGYFSGTVAENRIFELYAETKIKGNTQLRESEYYKTDFSALCLASGKRIDLGSGVNGDHDHTHDTISSTAADVQLKSGIYIIRAITVLYRKKSAIGFLEGLLTVV